jgi:hypothetical protein
MRRFWGTAVVCLWFLVAAGTTARDKRATFTAFDAPGAGTSRGLGTYGVSINTEGVIAGYYVDASDAQYGFIRAASSTISAFDAPGAEWTLPVGINAAGVIAGSYADANYVCKGADPWLPSPCGQALGTSIGLTPVLLQEPFHLEHPDHRR